MWESELHRLNIRSRSEVLLCLEVKVKVKVYKVYR